MSNSALFALLLAAGALTPGAALGQRPLELAMRGGPQPHFVAAWAPAKEREAERSAVLAGRVSLELANVSLDQALKTLTNEAGLNITYSPTVLPAGKRVTIKAGDIAVITALTEMLFRSGLDVVVDQDGTLALVRCNHVAPRAEIQDSGTIVGTVTDRATGSPLAGATVVLEGTRLGATTNGEGQYRIDKVKAGTYTVRARYIGYAALSTTVTVEAGEEVATDFALEKSVQRLEDVVTTGTFVPTEVKALPTPISIITASDIEAQHPQTISDVFRQAVPTAVAFDLPSDPMNTSFSLRGASSLVGPGPIKIFVDGVEAASFGLTPVDPSSIERIEVIRGPQASTLYGPDAAGGVMQIFTKRGDAGLARPQVEAQAEVGLLQTPYEGADGVTHQRYKASIRGGASDATYNFGGGYTRLGDWVPNGELSGQSSPSVYGGISLDRGIINVDLSGRYLRNEAPFALNPLLLQTGFFFFSQPFYQRRDFTNEMISGRIVATPVSWWRSALTLGTDRETAEQTGTRPRLTTPDDTLLTVGVRRSGKRSIAFNSSVQQKIGTQVSGSLTIGFDHYTSNASNFNTAQALNTEGDIQTAPPGAFVESRAVVTNTGYFAQAQVSYRDALFVTTGLRAEENSTFGTDLGTPVSPRFGVSYVQPLGATTIKIRGSYGRAIRAPAAGQAFGSVAPTRIDLANPLLQPERQQGWDAGIDLVFGTRATLSLTGYDQTAKNLILFVQVATDPLPTFQFQNLGRVSNKGVEVEAALNFNRVQLRANYGYVRSRIEDLGPTFQGDEHVGDRPRQVPTHTAGASLLVTPIEGTTLTGGLTYVGSFRQYDELALFSCFGGTGPCQPTTRDYIIDFPGFVKIGASLSQRLTSRIQGFVSAQNLTGKEAYEGSNTVAVMGRMTSVGLQLRY